MKRLLSTLLVLVLVSLASCSSPNPDKSALERTQHIAQQRQLQQVQGSFVSFSIETYMGISCSAYERQFSDATPFLIQDTAQLHAIIRRLSALQPDTSCSEVDVRAKAVLSYTDHTRDTLCMDQFSSVYRGRSFTADTLLYHLLGIDLASKIVHGNDDLTSHRPLGKI
jgi:hypothetical protein